MPNASKKVKIGHIVSWCWLQALIEKNMEYRLNQRNKQPINQLLKYMLVAALEKMQGKNWLEGMNSWQSVFPLALIYKGCLKCADIIGTPQTLLPLVIKSHGPSCQSPDFNLIKAVWPHSTQHKQEKRLDSVCVCVLVMSWLLSDSNDCSKEHSLQSLSHHLYREHFTCLLTHRCDCIDWRLHTQRMDPLWLKDCV